MMKKIIVLLFTNTLIAFCFGQLRIITGKVIDEWGNPIPYANIVFRNHQGTTSGYDGSFKLALRGKIDERDIITCSHINYSDVKQIVPKFNSLIFALQRSNPVAEETVYLSASLYHKETLTKIILPDTINAKKLAEKSLFKEVEEEKVFVKVESPGYFKRYDNKDALRKYFERNIVYKDSLDSLQTDIEQERVTARFEVGTDGKATNPYITVSLNKAADEAVLDAIKKMPVWEVPAMQNGVRVKSYHELTVFFTIEWRYTMRRQ